MKRSKDGNKHMHKSGLDDSPSHLLHRVLQIALDIYNAEAGESALSQRQFAVLKVLETTPEGLSQTDLVKATGIDRSTLADLVARMLTKGLVVRERSLSDARANLVQMAEAGHAALADMLPRVAAADEKILGLLSPPKRESFVKLLRKIAVVREEAVAESEPKEKPAKKADKKPKSAKKKHAKKADKAAKKMKKLPFPPLSEGADVTVVSEELVHSPPPEA